MAVWSRRRLRHSLQSALSSKGRLALMVLAVGASVGAACFSISYRQGIVGSLTSYFRSVAPHGDRVCTVFAARRAPRDGGTRLFQLDDLSALKAKLSGEATFAAEWVYSLPIAFSGTHLTAFVDGREPEYAFAAGETPTTGLPLDEDDEVSKARVCILNDTLARQLFPGGGAIGQEITIRGVPFTVKGVYPPNGVLRSVAIPEESIAYIPFSTAIRRLFNLTKIGAFQFIVRAGANLNTVVESVRQDLRDQRGLATGQEDDFFIMTPITVAHVRQERAGTILLVGSVVTMVGVLLGGGVVVTVMFLASGQRGAEVGVKRAFGASRTDVFIEALTEAIVTCMLGLAFGLFLAGVSILVVRSLPHPPGFYPQRFLTVNWRFFVLPSLYTIFLGCVAAILPGLRAARVDPVDALR